MRPAIFALALLLAPAATFADDMTPGSDACKSALAQIEKYQDEAAATLDKTPAYEHDAYCAAMRHNAETIERAVKVYDACYSDAEAPADALAQLGDQATAWREMMIGESCPEP
jgi:hypothetical protein